LRVTLVHALPPPQSEEIDIAVRPGLSPGERTEQVESRDANPMKIRFVGAKLRDHVVSVHGWSPETHSAVLSLD